MINYIVNLIYFFFHFLFLNYISFTLNVDSIGKGRVGVSGFMGRKRTFVYN